MFSFSAGFTEGTASGTITVSLNVTGNSGPVIDANPKSLAFSLTQGATTVATQSIVIANSGGTAQNFTAASSVNSGSNWLTISPAERQRFPHSAMPRFR